MSPYEVELLKDTARTVAPNTKGLIEAKTNTKGSRMAKLMYDIGLVQSMRG